MLNILRQSGLWYRATYIRASTTSRLPSVGGVAPRRWIASTKVLAATHYETLGVNRAATPDQVKEAFRKKAKTIHPDVNPQPSAAAQFIELVKAYQVLIDERRRAVYDQQMAIGRVPQPPRSTRPQQQAAGGSGAAAAAAAAAQQAQRPGRQAGPFGQVEDEAQLDEELRAAISKARGILSEAEEARFRARLATKNAEIVKSRTQTELEAVRKRLKALKQQLASDPAVTADKAAQEKLAKEIKKAEVDFSQAKSRSREARKQATRARFYAQLRELEADEVSKRVRQMVAESAGLETGGGGGGSSSRGGGASAAAGGRRSYHTASGRSGEGSDWDDDDGESVFGADGGDEEEDGASDGFFMDDVEYEEVLRAYMGARPAAQQQRPAGSRSSRKW